MAVVPAFKVTSIGRNPEIYRLCVAELEARRAFHDQYPKHPIKTVERITVDVDDSYDVRPPYAPPPPGPRHVCACLPCRGVELALAPIPGREQDHRSLLFTPAREHTRMHVAVGGFKMDGTVEVLAGEYCIVTTTDRDPETGTVSRHTCARCGLWPCGFKVEGPMELVYR